MNAFFPWLAKLEFRDIATTIAVILSILALVYTRRTFHANMQPNLWLGQNTNDSLSIHNLGARAILVSRFYESCVYDNTLVPNTKSPFWAIEPNKSIDLDVAKPIFSDSALVFIRLEFLYGPTGKKIYKHSSIIFSSRAAGKHILIQGTAREEQLRNRAILVRSAVEAGLDSSVIEKIERLQQR